MVKQLLKRNHNFALLTVEKTVSNIIRKLLSCIFIS